MKKMMAFGAAALVAAAASALTVENVSIEQNPATHGITVGYDLTTTTGETGGFVTVTFITNGVPCRVTSHMVGDFGRVIPVGTGKKIAWQPNLDLGDMDRTEYTITARVSAWTEDAPPTYYVLDLTTGAKEFYETEGALPEGIDSDVYRTTKMVFRYIAAKDQTFRMGAPGTEWNIAGFDAQTFMGHETMHQVTFTKDYYMGVFEVTKAQFRQIYGSLPTQSYTGADADLCPVTDVGTWFEVRYNEGDCGAWPVEGRYPQNTHFLGKLRKRAGGTEIAYPGHTNFKAVTGNGYDLPTEAQWEYACRAGTTTAFNNGQDMTNKTTDSALNDIAWYAGTAGGAPHPVGRKNPNNWGLYDMLGNVKEWALDATESRSTAEDYYKHDRTDPEGVSPYAGSRVVRGGSWGSSACFCRSAARQINVWGNTKDAYVGFRVVCPVNEL